MGNSNSLAGISEEKLLSQEENEFVIDSKFDYLVGISFGSTVNFSVLQIHPKVATLEIQGYSKLDRIKPILNYMISNSEPPKLDSFGYRVENNSFDLIKVIQGIQLLELGLDKVSLLRDFCNYLKSEILARLAENTFDFDHESIFYSVSGNYSIILVPNEWSIESCEALVEALSINQLHFTSNHQAIPVGVSKHFPCKHTQFLLVNQTQEYLQFYECNQSQVIQYNQLDLKMIETKLATWIAKKTGIQVESSIQFFMNQFISLNEWTLGYNSITIPYEMILQITAEFQINLESDCLIMTFNDANEILAFFLDELDEILVNFTNCEHVFLNGTDIFNNFTTKLYEKVAQVSISDYNLDSLGTSWLALDHLKTGQVKAIKTIGIKCCEFKNGSLVDTSMQKLAILIEKNQEYSDKLQFDNIRIHATAELNQVQIEFYESEFCEPVLSECKIIGKLQFDAALDLTLSNHWIQVTLNLDLNFPPKAKVSIHSDGKCFETRLVTRIY